MREKNGAMMGKKRKNGIDNLRKCAEEKISKLPQPEELPMEEVRKLVHELRVHQIELEMQNDALREAQAELIESNSRYTDLYDFAPVGYLTIDEKSIIRQANLTLARQLEIERGGLIGSPFPRFITTDERDAFRSHLAGIFKDWERRTIETRLITKRSASDFPALLESIPVEGVPGGKQCRISVTDISERKKAEKAAELYMKRLERSNSELQEFAFIASHDLQEPLRKISVFGEMLVRQYSGLLADEGRDYLDRMVKSSLRMQDMINGLLSYSRVGTTGDAFRDVNLARVVGDVLADLDLRIEQVGAVFKVGDLPSIEADPRQMRQLFQNLLGNALKFHGEEKPVIKIYARPGSEGTDQSSGTKAYRIFVEDKGIDFDEKYLDRIFTLFQRLHGKSAYEGTGMGLAICKRIVERHHGAITAKSAPGKGSTFIVTLPLNQPEDEVCRPDSPQVDSADLGT